MSKQLAKPGRKNELKKLHTVIDEFAKSYLPRISVRFTDDLVSKAGGQSDIHEEIIHLSPKQELNSDAIGLGLSYAYRIGPKYRSMKLKPQEMYFLTLLHEIGHFKVREKIPKSYFRIEKEIIGESTSDRLIELSIIESRIKRRSGEKESAWKLRLADFMSWLTTGETISHHVKVENWAIDEFERKRKKINDLLLEAGLVS